MSKDILHGIYPILNIGHETDIEALLSWAVQLTDSGIKLVQVRVKGISESRLPMLLDEIVSTLRGAGLTVIINDYVEFVGLTGADGVHLGADDLSVTDARRILGQKMIIGATCRNIEQARAAVYQGASYVAAGSIYQSSTKSGLPIIGLKTLSEIAGCLSGLKTSMGARPSLCAIGGITKERLGEIISAGADMAAVVSAIQNHPDPLEASRALVNEWNAVIDTLNNRC